MPGEWREKKRSSRTTKRLQAVWPAIKRWLPIVGMGMGAFVVLVFLLILLWVQVQERMLRWRAERLMAEVHKIQLYQTPFADAQRLMDEWNRWGLWDGACTANDCRFTIELSDASWKAWHFRIREPFGTLLRDQGYAFYQWLGGRYGALSVSITVQDGKVWRTSAVLVVAGRPRDPSGVDKEVDLVALTKSRQRLRASEADWWIIGGDDALVSHPYYKAGRPSQCKANCEEAVVVYSTHMPQEDIVRLTSYDFSCLTRWTPCTRVEELLPAAQGWFFYEENQLEAMHPSLKTAPPKACDLPLWALARDQFEVVVADVKQAGTETTGTETREVDEATVVETLKGKQNWAAGTVVKVYPFAGEFKRPPFEQAEHLEAGKRYILLPLEDPRGNPVAWRDDQRSVAAIRCGAWADTPEARRDLNKGFAMNDELRGPEVR